MKIIEKVTVEQAKDSGLAIVLILLLVAVLAKKNSVLVPATGVLILVMTWPSLFKPWAWMWFGFSHLLGGFVSKILLTIVFAVIVVPIALVRRAGGADAMRLKRWKEGRGSVFTERRHSFGKHDLEKPY